MSKCSELIERLKTQIESKRYGLGDKLPSFRELATTYDVSYLTVSKAIKQLGEEHYVDLNHGSGAYVRWRPDGTYPTDKQVKLLLPVCGHPSCRLVDSLVEESLRNAGWRVETFHVDHVAQLIELVRDTASYSLLYGFNLSNFDDISTLCALGKERLVVINDRWEHFGVASSCADTSQVIRVAMAHLRSLGRRRIALFCTNLQYPEEMEYAAVWQSVSRHGNSTANMDSLLWNLELPQNSDCNQAVAEFLQNRIRTLRDAGIDAIISTEDEKAAIASGILQDHGFNVPGEISIVGINNSQISEMVRPQLTVVDKNLPRQVFNAVAMLDAKLRHQENNILLHLCEPDLVKRQST